MKFKKRIVYTILLVLVVAFITALATLYISDTSGTPEDYDSIEIASKVLQETQEVIIKTPRNYNKNKPYPVVYVIGGNSLTYTVDYDMDLFSRLGYSPEVIIVGIQSKDQKTRQRDLTPPFLKQDLDDPNSPLGKADDFLKFIEQEVITFVEKNYSTNAERTIIGHSREGLLVCYSLMAQPDLFDTRIALSPALWREDNEFVKRFDAFLSNNPELGSNLYMSMGGSEVDKMKTAFDLTVDVLKTNAPSDLNWKSYYMPDATHQTNHYLTASMGLQYFNDAKLVSE